MRLAGVGADVKARRASQPAPSATACSRGAGRRQSVQLDTAQRGACHVGLLGLVDLAGLVGLAGERLGLLGSVALSCGLAQLG